jgi:hypothetical protein
MQAIPQKIQLFVEGYHDKMIITAILQAAKLPLDRIEIIVANGKNQVLKLAQVVSENKNIHTILFVDADELFISDANQKYQATALEYGCNDVLFAIPEIESWLFADDILLKSIVSDKQIERLKMLPLPDAIPYPRVIANHLMPKDVPYEQKYRFLEKIDIVRAAARSASLKHFLLKIADLMECPLPHLEQRSPEASTVDLKIVTNLLKSVSNKDTVMLKTLSNHTYTAGDIENSVTNGTDLAREYLSDLFFVARDLLKRKAAREMNKKGGSAI